MSLGEFLFPTFCLKCGNPGSYLCKWCQRIYLQPYYFQKCHVCRHESHKFLMHQDCRAYSNLDGVVAGYIYDDLIAKLVEEVKYHRHFDVIKTFVELLEPSFPKLKTMEALTFVPTSWWRKNWRGFNQSELLARKLGERVGLPVVETLRRRVNTFSQVGQSAAARKQNLNNIFEPLPHLSYNKICLVDDVMTTGSTLENCAKALKSLGIKQVYGLVLARGAGIPWDLDSVQGAVDGVLLEELSPAVLDKPHSALQNML